MRSLVVLLVLTVEAIDELARPTRGFEERLRLLGNFLSGLGVNTYASVTDVHALRAAIGRRLANPDNETDPTAVKLLELMLADSARHHISGEPPPPPLDLAALPAQGREWLRTWKGRADVVLLDDANYERFADVDGDRSPSDLWVTLDNQGPRPLTLARVAHWQTVPAIAEAALRQIPSIGAGERRDEAAMRLFEPLIRFADEIKIVDRFLGKAAVLDALCNSPKFAGEHERARREWESSREPRAPFDPVIWLVSWISNHREPAWNLTLYTSPMAGYPLSLITAAVGDVLNRALADGVANPPDLVRLIDLVRHRDVAVEGYEGVNINDHARWLHMRGHAAICVDKGFDVFSCDPLAKGSTVFFAPRIPEAERADRLLARAPLVSLPEGRLEQPPRHLSHYAELTEQLDRLDEAQRKWVGNALRNQPRETITWTRASTVYRRRSENDER